MDCLQIDRDDALGRANRACGARPGLTNRVDQQAGGRSDRGNLRATDKTAPTNGQTFAFAFAFAFAKLAGTSGSGPAMNLAVSRSNRRLG